MIGEKNVPNKVVMSYAKRGHFESQKSNYKEVAIFIVYFNFFFNSWFLLYIDIILYYTVSVFYIKMRYVSKKSFDLDGTVCCE